MSQKPRVGAVICNYNKAEMVCDCIREVLSQSYKDFNLYVVDNGSTDDSVDKIKSNFNNQLTLIENKENLGGSGGFNTGLRAAARAGYEFLMCIDNDCILDVTAMERLVDFLDDHPEAGIAASRIYHLEQPEIIQNFGQSINYTTFATEANYLGQKDSPQLPEYIYADAVPACALMIRSTLTDKIGFLPEENYLYWDDTLWCIRAGKAGYKVASVGNSRACHSMGARAEAKNTFPTYYAWRNWIRFFAINTPDDKQEDMIFSFLSNLFYAQFEGSFKGEYMKASTIMAAYDDAIHGVTGRARDGIIGEVDKNKDYHKTLKQLKESPDTIVYSCDSLLGADTEASVASLLSELPPEELSRSYICDENDIIMPLSDYPDFMNKSSLAREVFISSQLPLFLRGIEIIKAGN